MRTVVVSRGPSAASARLARSRPAPPAAATPLIKRRRVNLSLTVIGAPSRLQLAFDLVEGALVGAVGDDLLRGRFDETQFMQPLHNNGPCLLGRIPAICRRGYLALS